MEKWLCLSAMILAGIFLLVYGLDLITGVPFGRQGKVQDVVFVIASALVLWQGYEVWREVT
ncbi:MAG: hypothetical protein HY000_02355 [Planctomycetes bacterium]|nr:hypothetical protein [Planctomycetota bacterium]